MRKPRKLKNNANYHVVATINRYENIFKSDEIKYLFLKIVKNAKRKYKFIIKNFCIMDNHIHLIIQPKENSNLSKIMQWILSVFAIWYNRIHRLNGHVWYDRFKSEIIESLNQFETIFKIISNYPVIKNKVKNAIDYKFGGLYFIRKGVFDVIEKGTEESCF
jgi:putative transposase